MGVGCVVICGGGSVEEETLVRIFLFLGGVWKEFCV